MKKFNLFVINHMEWIKKICSYILERKKTTAEDYCHTLLNKGMPADELGLFIFAKCYDIHIGVICGAKYWTTRKDNHFKLTNIKLIHIGRLYMADTEKGIFDACSNLEFQLYVNECGYYGKLDKKNPHRGTGGSMWC